MQTYGPLPERWHWLLRVVGMVFGGIVNESISYVSHIEDLFADIKEWANGEDIRIMEMGDDEKEPIDE